MRGDLTLIQEIKSDLRRAGRSSTVQLMHQPTGVTDNAEMSWELTAVKAIGRVLEWHYPGHAWAVDVMGKQGIAKITIPPLLGWQWGYIIKLEDLRPGMVIRAGGEILERFKIPRSTVDLAYYLSLKGKIPFLGDYRASHRNLIPA